MEAALAILAFQYTSFSQQVIFGRGALTQVGDIVARHGWTRILLCTSPSMRRTGPASTLEDVLGQCLVATFDGVKPHVQDVQVEEAVQLALRNDVNAVVGLGGGSPIGMAKAVAYALERNHNGGQTTPSSPASQSSIPTVAIPTTYAGSEMTAVYGMTHSRETPVRKVTVSDPRIAPKLVIYDPVLTLDLPPGLTASTGINALAHCVEALYAVNRHPASAAIAVAGLNAILAALLLCCSDGQDLAVRTQMLAGAHLAGLALASTSMGLHHGICHMLGGSANIPHGLANAIMLPHVIRFNADSTADQLLPLLEALGISVHGGRSTAIEEAAREISDLIGKMNLPKRLRDVGVQKADLQRLAELGFQNRTVRNNPKAIHEVSEIEALLEAAW
jgi:maleylacetate reductase